MIQVDWLLLQNEKRQYHVYQALNYILSTQGQGRRLSIYLDFQFGFSPDSPQLFGGQKASHNLSQPGLLVLAFVILLGHSNLDNSR
jgi:hypothetical protein